MVTDDTVVDTLATFSWKLERALELPADCPRWFPVLEETETRFLGNGAVHILTKHQFGLTMLRERFDTKLGKAGEPVTSHSMLEAIARDCQREISHCLVYYWQGTTIYLIQ